MMLKRLVCKLLEDGGGKDSAGAQGWEWSLCSKWRRAQFSVPGVHTSKVRLNLNGF